MRKKSKKIIETEAYVDRYTSENGFPPTYVDIQEEFGLSACAAYARCERFRNKMRQIRKKAKIKYAPTKEEIIKTLYSCAKTTNTDEGLKIERVFEREAEAILKLLTATV